MGYDHWENSHTVLLDNPTYQEINFQIDGIDYHLDPRGSMPISLEAGEHTIKMNNQEKTFTKPGFKLSWAIFSSRESLFAVLNPTESTYILSHEIYGGEGMSDQELEAVLPKYDCQVEGQLVQCEYEKIDYLYFERVINYKLDEKFPNEIHIRHGGKYIIHSKLFR